MELLQSELNILLSTYTREKETLSNLISNCEKAEKNAKEEDM